MPGMYDPEEYDLAGFAVGACEKSDLIDGTTIKAGDVLIGLGSSGIHSNGYSLVRKLFFEKAKMDVADYVDVLGCTLGEELLRPTRIYVQPVLSTLQNFRLKGMAHITGGGFIENIPRMLPSGLGAVLEEKTWDIPPIFPLMESIGGIERLEMYSIFNMGIGMVIAVDQETASSVVEHFQKQGEKAYLIGQVVEEVGVRIV